MRFRIPRTGRIASIHGAMPALMWMPAFAIGRTSLRTLMVQPQRSGRSRYPVAMQADDPNHKYPRSVPSASVIVPTFNRPAALARTLSALRAMDTPPGDLEIVVVDSGA